MSPVPSLAHSLGPRRPYLQEEGVGFLGNWWGMKERGGGWCSCWGVLRGSICHSGCPVNYSAAVRTDSLPVCHLLLKPACWLLLGKPSLPLSWGLEPLSGASSLRMFFLGILNLPPMFIITYSLALPYEPLPGYFLCTNHLTQCTDVETVPTRVGEIMCPRWYSDEESELNLGLTPEPVFLVLKWFLE